jgi:hypothetical protein
VVKKWSDIVWLAKYFAPWIKRRLTGKSSGDKVLPKRPQLIPLLEQTVNSALNGAGASGLNSAGLGGTTLTDQAA